MVGTLPGQVTQHVHGVERVPDRGALAALVAHAMAQAERPKGRDETERDCDRPRQREAEAGVRRPTREDDHGGERGHRCEHGVLEHPQAKYAHARLAWIEPGVLEGMAVDDEAAADDEDTEPCGDDRTCAPDAQARAAL